MSYPVDNQKKFEDWTFDDLQSWAAWKVASGLINGMDIKSCMYEVIVTVKAWNVPKTKTKVRKKK